LECVDALGTGGHDNVPTAVGHPQQLEARDGVFGTTQAQVIELLALDVAVGGGVQLGLEDEATTGAEQYGASGGLIAVVRIEGDGRYFVVLKLLDAPHLNLLRLGRLEAVDVEEIRRDAGGSGLWH